MIWKINGVLSSFGGNARTFCGKTNYFKTLRIDAIN